MFISLLYIAISLVLLFFGANMLVKGSSALALRFGISPLVAGLTVVAFGTSAPELVVSINASISNHGNMAIGNVLGSNIFNICIILGLSSIIAPLKVKMQLLKFDIPILTIFTLIFLYFFNDRQISFWEGILFLSLLITYTIINIILSKKEKNIEVLEEFNESVKGKDQKWYFSLSLVLAGITILIVGSELLIKGAVFVARYMGVGETIISITILAAGTSLPELASSIVATIKKEYDIAIGNVIGSNIFNIVGILGISAIIKPLNAIAISNIDLYFMVGISLLLIPFLRTHYTLKRDEGIFMIFLYLAYLFYLWPK